MVSRQFRALRSALITSLCATSLFFCGEATAARVLVLADLHFDQQVKGSDYGKDAGQTLMAASLAQARHLIDTQHPAFVIVLGDLPSHTFFLADRIKNITASLQALRTSLNTPGCPIFLVPGNNDAPTGNYHSYSDQAGHSLLDLDSGWPAQQAAADCHQVDSHTACISDGTAMHRYGYYAAYPLGTAHHLQLVVLNSIIFTAHNYDSDDGVSQADAAKQQLAWLAQVLAQAQHHHDAVMIALHIPPGLDAYNERPMWSTLTLDGQPIINHFLELVDRYRDEVRIVLSGHTHMEEVRRLYNAQGKLIALDLSTASISPIHDNNPSMKMLTLDAHYTVRDSASYYTWPTNPTWQTDPYLGTEQYGCDHSSLTTCLSELNEEELLARLKPYYFALGRGHSVDWQPIANSTLVRPISAGN